MQLGRKTSSEWPRCLSKQSIREPVAHESIFNLIHHESVIKVDCIAREATHYGQTEFARRRRVSILDFNTYLASKEDLTDEAPALQSRRGMSDTPPEIKQMVREQVMARPAEERFVMGGQMFDAAVAMLKASLPADLSETEQKRQLFNRLYGIELLA